MCPRLGPFACELAVITFVAFLALRGISPGWPRADRPAGIEVTMARLDPNWREQGSHVPFGREKFFDTDETAASKLTRICNQRWATQGMCAQCHNSLTVYPASGAWKGNFYCIQCWSLFLHDEDQCPSALRPYTYVPGPSPYPMNRYTDNLDRVMPA